MTPQTMRRIALTVAGVVAAILALWLAAHIPRTITIFVIAAFIAFGVQPIAAHLERRGVKRVVAIAFVYVVLLLILGVGALIVLPATIDQGQALVQNSPAYLKAAQDWMVGGELTLRERFAHANLPPSLLNVQQLVSGKITSFLTTSMSSLGGLLVGAATAVFIAVSGLILSFFFLMQSTQIAEGFVALFPARKQGTARSLTAEIAHMFGSFISGQAIVCAITGVVITILLAIIGFKFALIMGLISGVAYAIPIFGMVGAQLLAAVISAPQGVWMVLWVQLIIFTIARISDNVLVPKIMGSSVGVSPIGVMFAVFAGGELFGFAGLILGIPAAALIKILWRYFVAPWLTGHPVEPVDLRPAPRQISKKAYAKAHTTALRQAQGDSGKELH
ncbi:MAG: AI-2E family transporter [Candidatus Eremiobacteraeota bacterium]|nr:AI-2E family transporter [Candidatus Eremiobacteraeota bacterium]MBV9737678.1 AI-2E family transporter [Candidatus Eremiobacteraeota bacterium]